MTPAPSAHGSGLDWLVASAGLVAGPLVALLHESRLLSVGPRATLWPALVVALAGGLGLAVGVSLARRRLWLPAAVVALPNAAVCLFYGFLVAFFALGGSR